MGCGKSLGTSVAAPAVKHNVVVIFPRSPHVVALLKLLWGQPQRLVHHSHWNSPTQRKIREICQKMLEQFCSLVKTCVACWQHLECVPPGIHAAPGRQTAGRYGWRAWSSAEDRSPLRLKLNAKNIIKYFSKYAPFLKNPRSNAAFMESARTWLRNVAAAVRTNKRFPFLLL